MLRLLKSMLKNANYRAHKPSTLNIKVVTIVTLAFMTHSMIAFAEEISPDTSDLHKEQIEYKLSLSDFSTQNLHANDVNLRADLVNQRGWIGFYKESSSGFQQYRAGYERNDFLTYIDLNTSLQIASHGFLGGSITATTSEPFFGVIGYGRTNLKPYANLNFDPNDAITLGFGYKKDDDSSISLLLVRDIRVVPGQQNLHLLVRSPLLNKQRVTLDVVNKSGPSTDQGQSIHGVGISITYDWPSVFLRLAYDPKVNFTQDSMTRLSIGLHF